MLIEVDLSKESIYKILCDFGFKPTSAEQEI